MLVTSVTLIVGSMSSSCSARYHLTVDVGSVGLLKDSAARRGHDAGAVVRHSRVCSGYEYCKGGMTQARGWSMEVLDWKYERKASEARTHFVDIRASLPASV